MSHAADIVFFDGDCLFCQKRVHWLLRHDRGGQLHFAPLQGTTAAALLPPELTQGLSTIVFATGCDTGTPEVRTKSAAIAAIAARLPTPWRLGGLLLLVPRPARDAIYDAIARRRHRLGGTAACRLPSAEEKTRFLP